MSYTFITRALYSSFGCVKIALPETHNPTLIYIFFYVIFLSFLFTHAWQASMHDCLGWPANKASRETFGPF